MRKWDFFTSKEISPDGWLKKQLEIQAEGLSGNLDKVWRDVRDSAWIGGNADGWERVPYWLDGFIPLAYLLRNDDMIARAKKYIDAIVKFQKPSGWICPCSDENIPTYDTWAVQLLSKVLVVYYECSGDERIPDVIYKMMKNYYELLSSGTVKLFQWGKSRWFEAFIALNFLKKRYDDSWILSLAEILKNQGTNYADFTQKWKRPLNYSTFETHIVNLGMMLKSEAVSCDLLNEQYSDTAEKLHIMLSQYNGTPVGLFTGDECLSGLSPIQGTELCGVVEQMYSYEHLFAYTGDPKWTERLELLAFNALPATISDDMWTHQYDQMSNQIACQRFPHKPIFRTNSSEAHIFGLEPNFGCCTANFGQGWPKFALATFMRRKGEIISAVPVPSKLDSSEASVSLETLYPFENKLKYTINAKENVIFKVRIPSFARNLKLNGEPIVRSDELSFSYKKGEAASMEIEFETNPELIDRPHNLKTAKCGSLVFSLPIAFKKQMQEYVRNDVERKFPYCDYELIPESAWNYAYSSPFLKVDTRKVSGIPFDSQNPPVVLKAEVTPISWGLEDGYEAVCAKVPESRLPIGPAKEIEFYPYGCAKLRMTELPLI